MSKKSKLDADKENRYKKLLRSWEKDGEILDPIFSSEKLTIQDICLLLENPSPLQDLIQRIVASQLSRNISNKYASMDEAAQSPSLSKIAQKETNPHPLIAQEFDLEHVESFNESNELSKAKIALKEIESRLKNTEIELAKANESLLNNEQKYSKKLKQAISYQEDATAKLSKLIEQENIYKQKIKSLHEELELKNSREIFIPELSFIRSDLNLAQAMDLTDLPEDDIQALIIIVAVLSQFDNIKRLWEFLKERFESENRPANSSEISLLQTALGWHNLNWRSLPYYLINPETNACYNFETHSRSQHVTKGENIVAVHLPGIADSRGKVLCKALVVTK